MRQVSTQYNPRWDSLCPLKSSAAGCEFVVFFIPCVLTDRSLQIVSNFSPWLFTSLRIWSFAECFVSFPRWRQTFTSPSREPVESGRVTLPPHLGACPSCHPLLLRLQICCLHRPWGFGTFVYPSTPQLNICSQVFMTLNKIKRENCGRGKIHQISPVVQVVVCKICTLIERNLSKQVSSSKMEGI